MWSQFYKRVCTFVEIIERLDLTLIVRSGHLQKLPKLMLSRVLLDAKLFECSNQVKINSVTCPV